MFRSIIYVFSGTKNTLLAAGMVKDALEYRNVHTEIFEVTKPFINVPNPNDYDYVGFAYPVHAFNVPQVFLEFVRQLPDAHRKAFIFKTSGEPLHANDSSSYRLYRILQRKGFDIFQNRHFLMPYNIMFRYRDSLAKQMHQTTEALSRLFAKQIATGARKKLRFPLRHRLLSIVLRIQQPAARFNGHFYSVNSSKCSQCMLCEQTCPTRNISFKDGKFKFDGSCVMCMRCVMFCPEDALTPGLLHFFKVNGAYEYERLLADSSVPSNYINENTTGYFRLFKKYFRNAAHELAEDAQLKTDDTDELLVHLESLDRALASHHDDEDEPLMRKRAN